MIWPFGRRKRNAPGILAGAEWRCSQCETSHVGVMDLAADHPDPWPGPPDYEPNADLTFERDFLSEDFCVLDGRYYLVRCVLEIPIAGHSANFGFGCWATLSRANFEHYVERFDNGDFAGLGPWSSWLCNDFAGLVGSTPIACLMFLQSGRQRPVLRVNDALHPIAMMQEHGIDEDELVQLYRSCGHPVV